jgi:hypothetical protein
MGEGAHLFMLSDRLDRIEGQLTKLVEGPGNVTELWLPKKRLALELGVSPRWIEDRIKEGLPHRVIAGKTLFRLKVVESWLKEQSYLREVG